MNKTTDIAVEALFLLFNLAALLILLAGMGALLFLYYQLGAHVLAWVGGWL